MPRTLSGLQNGEFDEIDIFHKITCNGNAGSLNQVLTNVDGVNTDWKTVDIPPQLTSGSNTNISTDNRINVVNSPNFDNVFATYIQATENFSSEGQADFLDDVNVIGDLNAGHLKTVSTINSTPIASYLNSNHTIPDNSITHTQIASQAITTDELKYDAVTTVKIIDDAITTAKIVDDAITTAKIVDDAITTDKIVDDAITYDKIAFNAVTTGQIMDGSVTNSKIIDYSITQNKIQDNAVSTLKIVDDAITTDKIVDDALTTFFKQKTAYAIRIRDWSS
eukprot:COSAG03_NODE_5057_length_1351_cov_1.071885_1_plen_278_part_10